MQARIALLSLPVWLLVAGVVPAGPSRADDGAPGMETPHRETRVYWDRGVNVDVRRFGLLEQVIGPASELLLHVRTGYRLSLDGAAYAGDDRFVATSDSGGLRRLYLTVAGEFWPWRRPVRFYLEIGAIDLQFAMDDVYVVFPGIPYLGDLRVGQAALPMSLDSVASSYARPFMEKSLPVSAFVPSSKAGIQLANRTARQNLTWAFGWFADGTNTDDGEDNNSPTRVAGRLTWVMSADDGADVPLVHLGGYGSYMYSSGGRIRYSSRPESHWAAKLFDTGDIDGRGAVVLGYEAAVAHGPASVQTELIGTWVQGREAGDHFFTGTYVLGTWSLTGEPRPYDRENGRFAAVTPERPVTPGSRNPGAWEAALRLSRLDLTNGGVRGGQGIEVMPGLNWYLRRNLRVQANYGYSHVRDGPQNGNLHLWQVRIDLTA